VEYFNKEAYVIKAEYLEKAQECDATRNRNEA